MRASEYELDLASMKLSPGAGRKLELQVPIGALELGGERYEVGPASVAVGSPNVPVSPANVPVGSPGVPANPASVPVRIDVSRMTGGGYALKLAMTAAISGPCMRCMKEAKPEIEVQAREVDVPGEGEELASPYVHEEQLDVAAWAHDALALAMPVKVLCREDCAGLCPICAADLNDLDPAGRAGLQHRHEPERDPRWAKLSELKLE
jgi:uncharacterized protein